MNEHRWFWQPVRVLPMVAVLSSGGHGEVIVQLLKASAWEVKGVYDDNEEVQCSKCMEVVSPDRLARLRLVAHQPRTGCRRPIADFLFRRNLNPKGATRETGDLIKASMGFTSVSRSYYYLRRRSPGPPSVPARPPSRQGNGGL